MKTTLKLLILIFLLFAVGRAFAMMSIANVSKEQAKEWGVELRFKPNGPKEFWVELEFKPQGKFKDFQHVNLDIRDGDKLLLGYAPLRDERLGSGNVVVHFMANRAYLEKVTLTIVIGFMAENGYQLHVKDFIESEKVP